VRIPAYAERRAFRRRAVARKPAGRSVPLPAPVEGWDAVSPLDGMRPRRAIQLDNWFPQPAYVELRRGHAEHSDTGSEERVESLMAFHGTTSSHLKAASGGAIYDVTAADAGVSELTDLNSDRWQHTNFTTIDGLNFLWICNGVDPSYRWDGASWTANTISNGITGEDVVHVAVFKGRLWLVVNGSLNAWYLGVGAVQGEATEFPLQGVFRKGGHLMAIGTWSLDGGAGPDDLIAFVSSRGEVAVYSGIDPGDSSFSLTGVYDTGSPIGRRCLVKAGGDLLLISIDGVLPLSQALILDRAALMRAAVTRAIQPVVNKSARDWGGNFGWQIISYPRGTQAILNVPVQEGAAQQQFVMNTVTGAWCRYIGLEANCWEVRDDRIFFGGNDGVVYEFDLPTNDNGSPIVCDVRVAFNYCGSKGLKRWTACRPVFTSNGRITPGIALNVDFGSDETVSVPNSIVEQGAQWDVAQWDVDTWPLEERIIADWHTVDGEGYCASLRLLANVDAPQGVLLRFNSYNLLMEDGGPVG
jgi:hypothetical protein